MKKHALGFGVALLCAVVAAAGVDDALMILARPLAPLFAWMLP